MDTQLVMVSVKSDNGKSSYKLARGKVLDDGKVIVKKSTRDKMIRELGIQRGENVHG